jgi:hypothetical protein
MTLTKVCTSIFSGRPRTSSQRARAVLNIHIAA